MCCCGYFKGVIFFLPDGEEEVSDAIYIYMYVGTQSRRRVRVGVYPAKEGLLSSSGFPLPHSYLSLPQAVIAALQDNLDIVAFTNEVPRLRKYLTKRFAAPGGILTAEAEAALDREAVRVDGSDG